MSSLLLGLVMRRTITLAMSLLLALAAAPGLAQGPPPPDLEAEAEATPQLRQALRDFYVRALEDELGLAETQSAALRPKVEALLDAQREGARGRVDVGLRVLQAARLDLGVTGDPRAEAADAVASALRSEADEMARIGAARRAVVGELSPRQAARFLAFEGRFQERVRRILQERRGGGSGGPLRDGGGIGEGAPPPPPPPGAPADPRGGPPDAGGRPGDEARKTALIVFTHQLRTRLELSDAQTLALLPQVEALFETRLKGERQRRILHERLLEAADDDQRGDADLGALVSEALAHDDDVPRRITAARSAVTSSLTPVQAARFLLLEHRAEREMRDQVRRARQGWAGARDEGPRGRPDGGGREGMGGPRGGPPGPGGGMRPPRPGGGGFRPRPGGGGSR